MSFPVAYKYIVGLLTGYGNVHSPLLSTQSTRDLKDELIHDKIPKR